METPVFRMSSRRSLSLYHSYLIAFTLGKKMIRVLIVDDESAVRQGLRMRLSAEPDVQVIGETANGQAALDLVQALQPEVVLMDVTMPQLDGIDATEALHAISPNTAVVMLTVYDDAAMRARARAAGAVAFITKGSEMNELLATIRWAAGQGLSNLP